MIPHAKTTLALSIAALVALFAPGRALADEKTECQIFEIKASNDKGGLDKALKPLAKKLKKPPFSSWKTFEVLDEHERSLEKMKSFDLKLEPGSKLSLLFRDVTREEGKKSRLRLNFTLDDERGKRKVDGTINLDSGDYYLIGGDSLKGGGTYILAIGCEARR